ncbi:MAG: zinc-ribbon domain-containing protein [Thermoanaerobaculia bacterium]|nr:zinc-ribbon domain-containing protein [Thermoanaerobaculia bacterium]
MEEADSTSDTGPCCPHCFSPIQEGVHFCPRCGRPLTGFAATDPIQSIRTEGELYRGAAHTTRPIVLVGMWLLSIPALLTGVVGVALAKEGFVLALVTAIFLFGLYGAILYRVTVNYQRARKQSENPERLHPEQPSGS